MPYRQSLWRTDITVTQAGVPYHLGLAAKWDGGEKTSDNGTYWTAAGEIQLGGDATRGDGKATYLYDENLDAIFRALDNGAGTMDATIQRTPVSDDGTPFASGGFTMTGKLKTVPQPSGEAGSNAGAEVELEFSLSGRLA